MATVARRLFSSAASMHGTTILCVRKGAHVAMIGDGQVTLGHAIVKPNANKVRKIGKFNICESTRCVARQLALTRAWQ